MGYQEIANGFILRFQKGEKLIQGVNDFCAKNSITTGFFYGLGAVLEAEVGYYNLDTKEYEYQNFAETMEIVSINGNVSMKDNKPFVHAHTVLAKKDFSTIGGHLKEATVGGTCELYLAVSNATIHRKFDEETALSLFEI